MSKGHNHNCPQCGTDFECVLEPFNQGPRQYCMWHDLEGDPDQSCMECVP
jgi:hypothetical protein